MSLYLIRRTRPSLWLRLLDDQLRNTTILQMPFLGLAEAHACLDERNLASGPSHAPSRRDSALAGPVSRVVSEMQIHLEHCAAKTAVKRIR